MKSKMLKEQFDIVFKGWNAKPVIYCKKS